MARIVRTIVFAIAGGALAPLINQLTLDLPKPYSNYVPLVGAVIVNAAVILVEEWRGSGVLRNASAPIQQLREPLK